jgi:hypothetical protein
LDTLVAEHWRAAGIGAPEPADDLTFFRRITLDLAGRIPTYPEAIAFAADTSADKKERAIRRLIEGPEFPLHFGNVLDEMIQGKYAGDREFIAYLRRAIAERKPWDRIFQDIIVGPWDTNESKPASRFLSRRIRDLDDMATDTSRVFFGIEIACAKCHDHPLVSDWTQHHYYGMASFFNRTYEFGKARIIGEKDSDEITFVDRAGAQSTARSMFLSGKVIEEPKFVVDPKLKDLKERRKQEGRYLEPPFSRRAQLVKTALEEKGFFCRAIVNQLWHYFLGRGLVHPVDQMHTENPPSVDGVLELISEDFYASGYDLARLTTSIVSSHAYQASGTWTGGTDAPAAEHFAMAPLRALTPRQFSFSVALATSDGTFDTSSGDARAERYRELESRSADLMESLDRRSTNFQSSAAEALFMSNNAAVQKLIEPAGSNLAARLTATPEAGAVIDTAFWTVLGRGPSASERSYLVGWFTSGDHGRADACSQLVWALVTSAEFRFNH